MKLVITGALGHIGSKLIREIPSAIPDVEIVMVDNLLNQRYPSVFNLPKNGNYKLIQEDILSADLDQLFDKADIVIHLAAITNAEGSFEIREEVEKVNHIGTEKVAKACIKAGSAMLYLSTTSVYGTHADTVDEDCPESDLKPQSPYAESKLQGEYLLQKLGNENKFRFITCRFGTICGVSPGMRFHTAVNKFCWQAVNGQPLTVWRTAMHQKRPYLTLQDAVNAMIFIIKKNLFDQNTYNVLTDNLTVESIINMIEEQIPDLQIEYVETEIMNQLSYHVLNHKFNDQGFEVIGNIRENIHSTLEILNGVSTKSLVK